MKMFVLAGLFLMRGVVVAQSANVGIGTTTPASRLTINGSVAAGYRSVTTTTYTLTDADYVVVYNGTSAGTLTLPAAISGTGNFAGRMYRVKNNARTALTLLPTGSERISNAAYVFIDSGSTTEVISTGATGGTTWEVTNTDRYQAADNIRGALSAAGCASCAAYDAAATNTWVPITEAEYNRVAALTGVTAAGATNAQMGYNSTTTISGNMTFTQNVDNPRIPAASYPVALSFRTAENAATGMVSGIKLKLSSTSQSAGYADYPPATTLPALTSSNFMSYYFLIKKPATPSAATQPSWVAMYQPATLVGALFPANSTFFSGTGDTNNPSSSSNIVFFQFQVLAAPNRL